MSLAVPDDVIPIPDLETVKRSLRLLTTPGCPFEVRGLPSRRSVICRDVDRAAEVVRGLAGDNGIYFTINPVRPDLTRAASDRDITERVWLMVDVDPERPADCAATDEERRAAAEVAHLVILHTSSTWGWPQPVVIDTGNGIQLFYRVELGNDSLARQWVDSILRQLADLYSTDRAKIDTSVCNASRIGRIPGTWNRKGAQAGGRVWRVCQLVRVPDTIEPVTVEQVKAVVQNREQSPVYQGGGLRVPLSLTNGDHGAWFRKAMENEIAQAMLAPPGERHNTLRAAARTLAGHLHHGGFTETELVRSLTIAGERSGLGDDEIRGVIAWGLENGKANQLPLPARLEQAQGAAHRPRLAIDPDDTITVPASDITPTHVEWLWPNRIPIGKLTTFAGWGGLGKSFVTLDIAARISVGAEWPHCGGETAETGNVLILNTEDDPSDTTVPRLMLAESGVDLRRIRFLKSQVLGVFTLADLEILDKAMGEMGGARLLIIDPATAHLGAANDHKNAELRALLMPLSLWAMERRVAVLLVTHVNKPQAGKVEALARVVGGVAWVNAVRAAVMFARDPEDKDRRIMIGMKSNLAAEAKGLSYKIVPSGTLAKVEWLDQVDTTADEAISGEKPKPRRVKAAEWLAEKFREKRVWHSNDLYAEGREDGVSRNAIFEAKDTLPIRKDKREGEDGRDHWYWMAKDGWPPPKNPEPSPEKPRETLGTLGTLGTQGQAAQQTSKSPDTELSSGTLGTVGFQEFQEFQESQSSKGGTARDSCGSPDQKTSFVVSMTVRWLVRLLNQCRTMPAGKVIRHAADVGIDEVTVRRAIASDPVFAERIVNDVVHWCYEEGF